LDRHGRQAGASPPAFHDELSALPPQGPDAIDAARALAAPHAFPSHLGRSFSIRPKEAQ